MRDNVVLDLSDVAALLAEQPSTTLPAQTFHTWAWALAADRHTLARASGLLDDDERARAARFIQEEHKDRFTIAHGVLRAVLARYASSAPASLRFVRGEGGKPALAGSPIAFNLSHSADRAVLAVGQDSVGVDVEHARPRLDPLGLASRYFFGAEHAAIRDAPATQQAKTFLRYWVAKEAVLKAQGVGLAFPLDAFAIAFAADGATARVKSSDPARLSPAWTVRMLSLGADWPVAVAAAGDRWSVVPCKR